MTDETEEKSFNKGWLILAIIGFVAAFLFQWKNSINQGAIAQTDSDEVVRVKFEDGNFKIFSNGKTPFAEALLCDERGNVIGKLSRRADGSEIFELCRDAGTPTSFPQDRFLHVVIPALKSEGHPVVLITENPFR
ncbi:MAG: hypothetical protein IJW12_01785 [Opitutales bacterium]|nr:hypothetical protein [Opitutales bacterium]